MKELELKICFQQRRMKGPTTWDKIQTYQPKVGDQSRYLNAFNCLSWSASILFTGGSEGSFSMVATLAGKAVNAGKAEKAGKARNPYHFQGLFQYGWELIYLIFPHIHFMLLYW